MAPAARQVGMSTPLTGPGRAAAAPPVGRRAGFRGRIAGAGALLLPIVELAVLIQVGSRIGVGITLLLLLAAAVAGSLVLRQVGTDAIRRLGAASGRDPATTPLGPGRPPAESALVVIAGLLLLVPGFLSDVAALVLLVPAVRRALVRRTGEAVLRRFQVRQIRVVQGEVVGGGPSAPSPSHVDVRVIQSRPPGAPPTP
jgi:UPF0716 protein FxsA